MGQPKSTSLLDEDMNLYKVRKTNHRQNRHLRYRSITQKPATTTTAATTAATTTATAAVTTTATTTAHQVILFDNGYSMGHRSLCGGGLSESLPSNGNI